MDDLLSLVRSTIARLDSWVHRLAEPLLPAVRKYAADGSFQWEFTEQTPRVVLLAKSVRMVSATRAALLLADAGMPTESTSLLRMVADFASEILAIGEGMLAGEETAAQQKFVRQFFLPLPTSLEEYAAREKDAYVEREDSLRAHVRLARTTGPEGELHRN